MSYIKAEGVVYLSYAAIQKDRGTGPDDVLATYYE